MNCYNNKFITKERYRISWFGKLILQVFEQNSAYETEQYRNSQGGWRDAKIEDLLEVVK